MVKYRKKPVVIDAILWTGDNGGELRAFVGSSLSWNPLKCEAFIETSEGIMKASEGDWIIKGVKGEFYLCKPDIFDATYELVKEVEDEVRNSTKRIDQKLLYP